MTQLIESVPSGLVGLDGKPLSDPDKKPMPDGVTFKKGEVFTLKKIRFVISAVHQDYGMVLQPVGPSMGVLKTAAYIAKKARQAQRVAAKRAARRGIRTK